MGLTKQYCPAGVHEQTCCVLGHRMVMTDPMQKLPLVSACLPKVFGYRREANTVGKPSQSQHSVICANRSLIWLAAYTGWQTQSHWLPAPANPSWCNQAGFSPRPAGLRTGCFLRLRSSPTADVLFPQPGDGKLHGHAHAPWHAATTLRAGNSFPGMMQLLPFCSKTRLLLASRK